MALERQTAPDHDERSSFLMADAIVPSVYCVRSSSAEAEPIPYQPISQVELSDLEREAGRPLTQEQATRYRLSRLKQQLIAAMLRGGAK